MRPSRCRPAVSILSRSAIEFAVAAFGHFLLQDLAVADDRVERRAQLVAHVGEELALGGTRLVGLVARCFKAFHQLRELRLALLERADVAENGHRPRVARAALADSDPAAVLQPLLDDAGRIAVVGEARRHPFLDMSLRLGDEPALRRLAHDVAETRAGNADRREFGIDLVILAIGKNKAVAGVVKAEPFRYAFDRIEQPRLGLLRGRRG